MKKTTTIILMFFLPFLITSSVYAQKNVTTFLGIPVDGNKSNMILELKNKGFTMSTINDHIMEGEFNGMDVSIHIVTNNNKVYRIVVHDDILQDEANIKIRFNSLCRQFENNNKYTTIYEFDQTIPEEEDISYEMTVNNKLYQAGFYQRSKKEMDSTYINKSFHKFLLTKYSKEEMQDLTVKTINDELTLFWEELLGKKLVWFTISEFKGEYYISMYYDNKNNQANGEDL